MREIKFRAWDGKKMIGTYDDHQTFALDFSGNLFSYKHGNTPFAHYVQEELILMQYTGLKDKNGKEIFEGDLIGYWSNAFWVVGWSEKKGRYMFQYPGCKDDFIPSTRENLKGQDGFAVTKSVCEKKEIIGNIYENPELLTQSK